MKASVGARHISNRALSTLTAGPSGAALMSVATAAIRSSNAVTFQTASLPLVFAT